MMEVIEFQNVTFTYQDSDIEILKDVSLAIPKGITVLVGQNGTGKSTFLLLASASIQPGKGTVIIAGIDSRDLRDETVRHEYISYIFQNMEFETEDSIENLLKYVYSNGFHKKMDNDFLTELIDVFELGKILNKPLQNTSKGEMQRTILAFSLLFGSKILIMDEPIFALEEYQKKRIMDYLAGYVKKTGISLIYTLHELNISEKYSDYALLFYKDRHIEHGSSKEILTKENIESAYEVPYYMLKTQEALTQRALRNFLRKKG